MLLRLARAYVRILFAIEIVLFASSLSLHLVVLCARRHVDFGILLFFFVSSIVAQIMVVPFVKENVRWWRQVKRCPGWMWKPALALLWVYPIVLISFSKFAPAVAISGFPIIFDAINICVLYTVVRLSYLEDPEIARGARFSVLAACAVVAMALAYHAGYFHRPEQSTGYSSQ
jgi:hypothetical protein